MNKETLLNILPNISTLVDENLDFILSKALYNHELIEDNLNNIHKTRISSEESRIRNLAIKCYQKLFQKFPNEFANYNFSLQSLSRLVTPIFDQLSQNTILVSIIDLFSHSSFITYIGCLEHTWQTPS